MQTLHVVLLLRNTLCWRIGLGVTFRKLLPEWETSRTSCVDQLQFSDSDIVNLRLKALVLGAYPIFDTQLCQYALEPLIPFLMSALRLPVLPIYSG